MTTQIRYDACFEQTLNAVNAALSQYLAGDDDERLPAAKTLWEAMRYSTLDGGKRIRSVLAVETCLAFGGQLESILPLACAIELVHAQSLIHDDLPCMDNDQLRRGKPTLHVAYDEATAVLAGDALLAMAFGVITQHTPLSKDVSAESLLQVISDFSDVTSIKGLVNGQYVDILYEGKPYNAEVLEYIHTYKTGALFQFSARSGARLAGVDTTLIEAMSEFGQTIGLAFQIVDDLLDIQSTSDALGKTAGKDLAQQKATFPSLYGMDASRRKAEVLIEEAVGIVNACAKRREDFKTESLVDLANYIHTRLY